MYATLGVQYFFPPGCDGYNAAGIRWFNVPDAELPKDTPSLADFKPRSEWSKEEQVLEKIASIAERAGEEFMDEASEDVWEEQFRQIPDLPSDVPLDRLGAWRLPFGCNTHPVPTPPAQTVSSSTYCICCLFTFGVSVFSISWLKTRCNRTNTSCLRGCCRRSEGWLTHSRAASVPAPLNLVETRTPSRRKQRR